MEQSIRPCLKAAAGSSLPFEQRGDLALKGVGEPMPLHAAANPQREGMRM